VLRAGRDGLVKAGVGEELAAQLFNTEPEQVVVPALQQLYKGSMDFISFNSPQYPSQLKLLEDYPIGIFVRGTIPDLSRGVLAVVGSRRCTRYGATTTYDLVKMVAQAGVVVVSGMADGIDSMAHKATLDGGGKTIAVLGCGADICYPAGNRELMERIMQNGCVMSEYPPGMRPSKYTFPARNRIISVLSEVVAVMEADERSGTLITVDHANSQGKTVMAMPGNITSRLSRGTNRLISEGAIPITCVEDIFTELKLDEKKLHGRDGNKDIEKNNFEKNNISLAPEEKLVYDCIHSEFETGENVSADDIIIKTGMAARDVQRTLALLELKGLVVKLSGQQYIPTQ
jgi:DNA processing protein